MNYRICEQCSNRYSTGKDYGDVVGVPGSLFLLKEIDESNLEVKGLCEFCNTNTYVGVVHANLICTTLICEGCERPSSITGDYCNKTTIEEKKDFYKKVMYTKREEPLKAFKLLE